MFGALMIKYILPYTSRKGQDLNPSLKLGSSVHLVVANVWSFDDEIHTAIY